MRARESDLLLKGMEVERAFFLTLLLVDVFWFHRRSFGLYLIATKWK